MFVNTTTILILNKQQFSITTEKSHYDGKPVISGAPPPQWDVLLVLPIYKSTSV